MGLRPIRIGADLEPADDELSRGTAGGPRQRDPPRAGLAADDLVVLRLVPERLPGHDLVQHRPEAPEVAARAVAKSHVFLHFRPSWIRPKSEPRTPRNQPSGTYSV